MSLQSTNYWVQRRVQPMVMVQLLTITLPQHILSFHALCSVLQDQAGPFLCPSSQGFQSLISNLPPEIKIFLKEEYKADRPPLE